VSTNLISSNSKWKKSQHQTQTPNFTNNITRPVMSHGYSLRSHAKGHRGHQTTDEPEGQDKGTTRQSTSTDGILASKGGHDILTDELEDEPGIVESRPITPYPSRAAHITPAPKQDPEEDWQRSAYDQVSCTRHSRNIGRDPSSSQARRSKTHCRSRSHTATADRVWVPRGPACIARAY